MNDLIKQLWCGITDRGNTALSNPETGGHVFFAELAFNVWLEISVAPENHPAWNVSLVKRTKNQVRDHIEENLSDTWYIQRNNLNINNQNNCPVEREYVMERVRDKLYVYRDNKDFETKDTVTVIHDFLTSNDWTLDITDIETLRQESDN